MPDDSNGVHSLPPGTIVNSGDPILPSQHNPMANDLSSGLSARFSKDGRAPATGNWNLNTFRITNLGTPTASADAATKAYVDGLAFYTPQTLDASQQAAARKNIGAALTTGQCRLTLSGGNLVLSRHNGIFIPIGGVAETIPSGGVSLAATGLTPATLYYIYAYMNTGTMTLEASATAPTADATTGIQVKTGDSTHTLVGMARPVTGPAWVDSAKQRFVLSYYNRTKKRGESSFTATRSTSSDSFVEINTEIRVEFLAWGDTSLWFSTGGAMATNPGSGQQASRLALDGTVDWFAQCSQQTALNYIIPLSMSGTIQPTLGYHYATLLGGVTTGTGLWLATGGAACFIFASIEG